MQQIPFNNYSKERSKKQLSYFMFLAIVPTIIVACALYAIIGYLSPEDPHWQPFITCIAGIWHYTFIIACRLQTSKK